MAIKRELVNIIKKGNYKKLNNDNYTLESEKFGDMKITIYDDWIHTQLLDYLSASSLLAAWEGNSLTGKCNFMETDEDTRLRFFRCYMNEYIEG